MSVCLVCPSIQKPSHIESSYLHTRCSSNESRVKFVYEGHRVNVKVTGAKKVANACSCIDQLPSAIFIGIRQMAPSQVVTP